MTTVVLLVLLSALLHAAWNAALKGQTDASAASCAVIFGAALVSALLAAIVGPGAVPLAALFAVGLAGLVEGAYFVTVTKALELLPLSAAYGISRGAGVLLVWPLSIAVFGEPATPLAILGAILLSLGLLATASGASPKRGVAVALVAALTIGAYPVVYKQALAAGAPPFSLFALSLIVALPIQVAALGETRWRRLRQAVAVAPVTLGVAAALCAGSFLIFLIALTDGGAGRLTGLRNTSVLFASVFGYFTGDRVGRRGVVGAAAIALGAVLVALETA